MFVVACPESQSEGGEVKAPWVRPDDPEVKEEEFDEEAYLRGRIPLLRESVDKELPPRQGDEGLPPIPGQSRRPY